ncbi:MAG: hypothetical protein HY689_03700, partial [Chloroflexi bacterium]|nr:hypothetical protein [Chloroflexota bacterium]
PLDRRRNPDPALAFSSVTHGDPFTTLPRAYAGDPVVFRLLTSATNEVNTFRLTGHLFSLEPFAPQVVDRRDAVPFGISEREDAYLEDGAGSVDGQTGRNLPGDYLWFIADHDELAGSEQDSFVRGGSWGIFRVHDTRQPDLLPLPGREPPSGPGFPRLSFTGGRPPRAADPGDPCPLGAPLQWFKVSAVNARIRLNPDESDRLDAAVYVLDADLASLDPGRDNPTLEPLVIRANDGDCVQIDFTNRLTDAAASLHVGRLAADPLGSMGITVGFNPDQTVRPGERITSRLFAGAELGTALIRDWGDVFQNPQRGLYGAMIVEPKGAIPMHPATGAYLRQGSQAVIALPDGTDFREFVALFHEEDAGIGIHQMPYRPDIIGNALINYHNAPLAPRRARDPDPSRLFSSTIHGDPATPVFRAITGDPVTFRVVSGFGQQSQPFSLEGHQWPLTPLLEGSDLVYSRQIGPTDALDARLQGGAGQPGTYLYLNQRLPYLEGGMWGLLRVQETASADLPALPDRDGPLPPPLPGLQAFGAGIAHLSGAMPASGLVEGNFHYAFSAVAGEGQAIGKLSLNLNPAADLVVTRIDRLYRETDGVTMSGLGFLHPSNQPLSFVFSVRFNVHGQGNHPGGVGDTFAVGFYDAATGEQYGELGGPVILGGNTIRGQQGTPPPPPPGLQADGAGIAALSGALTDAGTMAGNFPYQFAVTSGAGTILSWQFSLDLTPVADLVVTQVDRLFLETDGATLSGLGFLHVRGQPTVRTVRFNAHFQANHPGGVGDTFAIGFYDAATGEQYGELGGPVIAGSNTLR